MGKLEKAIGVFLIILLAVFLVPVLFPILGSNSSIAWFVIPAFIIGIVLIPIAIAYKKK